MKAIVKPLIVLVILAIAGFYLLRPAQKTDDASSASATAAQPSAAETTNAAAAQREPARQAVENRTSDVSFPPQTIGEAPVGAAADSAVSTTPSGDSQPQTAERETDSAAGADAAPIVVPESYPVQDAAKYFIPADQRRPGNLGGPPPPPPAVMQALTAPAAPGGGLAPPPAPGN